MSAEGYSRAEAAPLASPLVSFEQAACCAWTLQAWYTAQPPEVWCMLSKGVTLLLNSCR